MTRASERRLAASLFNRAWDLLAQGRRSPDEKEEMLRTAHASAYHWYRIGTSRNFSIAEWQLSRVYSVLRRPEPALHHGERSLRLAKQGRLAPFYVAYGHEALARAYSIARERALRDRHLREARRLVGKVREPAARRLLEADLLTIR